MIFSAIGTGYGAYRGAKSSPSSAATYAILGSLAGAVLDVIILGGIMVATGASLSGDPTSSTKMPPLPPKAGQDSSQTVIPNPNNTGSNFYVTVRRV